MDENRQKRRIAALKTYKFKKVKELPPQPKREPSKYLEILQAFLATKREIVRLDLKWSESPTWGELESIVAGLRSQAKQNNLEVVVRFRAFDIYLQRVSSSSIPAFPILQDPRPWRKDSRLLTEAFGIIVAPERAEKTIEELELSVRTYNTLKNLGVTTIGDLAGRTVMEIHKHCGRATIKEIEEIFRV